MKQLPAILFAIATLVLAGLLLNARKEITLLKVQLADEQTERGNTEQRKAAAPAVKDKTAAPDAIAAGTSAPQKDPTNNVDTALVEQTMKNHQRVMSSIAKMRENPTMNKMIEASQRGTIGALYADMIEYLDLTPEETNYFMDLLMQRQMENVDFGMKLMSGQLTEEQKKELAEHLAQVSNEMKAQMKTFLNSETDYKEFEFYEKTIGERMALSQMDQQLSGSEQALSNDNYRELLGMMNEQRNDFNWSTDLYDQEKTDISPERFSKENMRKHTDDVHRLNKQIIERAAQMLTPEQLDAFRASITATTDMQLAQFEMAGQLLRGGK